MRTCSREGCERPWYCRDLCRACYMRAWKAGTLPILRRVGKVKEVHWLPVAPLRERLETVTKHRRPGEIDRLAGLSHGQTRHLLVRNKYVHIDIADRICIALGLPFDAMFNHSEGVGSSEVVPALSDKRVSA